MERMRNMKQLIKEVFVEPTEQLMNSIALKTITVFSMKDRKTTCELKN